jgi:hypothetical protein
MHPLPQGERGGVAPRTSSFSPCGRRWRDANTVSSATDEGSASAERTPHPPSLRSGTLSHKGRGGSPPLPLEFVSEARQDITNFQKRGTRAR